MANIKVENEFVCDILEGKLTFEQLIRTNFEAGFLEYNGEIYEWLLNYKLTNDNLPSLELVQTRYPEFQTTETNNNPVEVIEALRKNSEMDRFIATVTKANNILVKTASVEASRNYLSSELEKFDNNSEQDVFDLSTDEDAEKLLQYYEIRRKSMLEHGTVGIPSGFGKEFDNWLNGGSIKTNLYGILAPLGVGKTWSSMIIGGAALDYGVDPFMLFLEGNLEKEGYRSLSVGTTISNSSLHTAQLEVEDVAKAIDLFKRKAREHNSHYYLAVHGNRSVYTPSILRSKLVKYKPGIAIIDYLALMGLKTGDRLVDEWQVYSYISRELKKMAVGFDIPIWVTLQGNRGSNSKEQLSADDSSYYNLQRDFDAIIGISKVKGKQYLIRLNAVKGRDSKDEFKALYRTNWDNGKVVFESYVDEDSEF
jgi:replicative DNA helicase